MKSGMMDAGRRLRFKWQVRFSLAIAKKDARIYYLKGPVLIFGLFFPLCLFGAFVFGRKISPTLLMPGLLGMTLFFISSSATPVIAPWEALNKTLERLVSTPASVSAIIAGDILAGFAYGILVSLVPLGVGLFAFGLTLVRPAVLILTLILSAVCFAGLGTLFSTLPTTIPSNIMLLSNLVRLPLLFISGVFMPLERMPGWGKALSVISPLTYTCDLARHALLGRGYFSISRGLVTLFVFAVAFVFSSIQIHKKTMSKRLA